MKVAVDARQSGDASRYALFTQDGISISYSPRLARRSAILKRDYAWVLFRSKPILTGPDELVAAVVMGRI